MATNILLPTDHPAEGIERPAAQDTAAHEAALAAAAALAELAVPEGLEPKEYLFEGSYEVLVPKLKAELKAQGHHLNSSAIRTVLDAEAVRRGVADRPIYSVADVVVEK